MTLFFNHFIKKIINVLEGNPVNNFSLKKTNLALNLLVVHYLNSDNTLTQRDLN